MGPVCVILESSWCESQYRLCHIRPVVWFLLDSGMWPRSPGPQTSMKLLLRGFKTHVIPTMFRQTQNRMKLMADNCEDDHLKTAPDHTNHKPSPDQVLPPNHPCASRLVYNVHALQRSLSLIHTMITVFFCLFNFLPV